MVQIKQLDYNIMIHMLVRLLLTVAKVTGVLLHLIKGCNNRQVCVYVCVCVCVCMCVCVSMRQQYPCG